MASPEALTTVNDGNERMGRPLEFPEMNVEIFVKLRSLCNKQNFPAGIGPEGTIFSVNDRTSSIAKAKASGDPIPDNPTALLKIGVQQEGVATALDGTTLAGHFGIWIAETSDGKYYVTGFTTPSNHAKKLALKNRQAPRFAWALMGRMSDPPLFPGQSYKLRSKTRVGNKEMPLWIASREQNIVIGKRKETPKIAMALPNVTREDFGNIANLGTRGKRRDGGRIKVTERQEKDLAPGSKRYLRLVARGEATDRMEPERGLPTEWSMELGLSTDGTVYATSFHADGTAPEKHTVDLIEQLLSTVIDRGQKLSPPAAAKPWPVDVIRAPDFIEHEVRKAIYGIEDKRMAILVEGTERMEVLSMLFDKEHTSLDRNSVPNFPAMHRAHVRLPNGKEVVYLWNDRADLYRLTNEFWVEPTDEDEDKKIQPDRLHDNNDLVRRALPNHKRPRHARPKDGNDGDKSPRISKRRLQFRLALQTALATAKKNETPAATVTRMIRGRVPIIFKDAKDLVDRMQQDGNLETIATILRLHTTGYDIDEEGVRLLMQYSLTVEDGHLKRVKTER